MVKRSIGRRTACSAAALALVFGSTLSSVAGQASAQQAGKASPEGDAKLGYSLPSGFATAADFQAVNDQLQRTAKDLTELAAKAPDSGYAGVELSLAGRSVVLYWHGERPSAVDEAIARQPVRVEVRAARYSHRQLLDQARKLLSDNGIRSRVPIVRVAVPADGTALQVGVAGPVEQARRQLPGDLDAAITREHAAKALYSRVDDSPPFWGGARIANVTRGLECSTGFAVQQTTGTAMLTAGHCGENGDTFTTGLGTFALGQATGKDATADTLLIPSASAGRVYDGDAWSSSSRPVAGTAPNYAGAYTCTLGAYSGGRCDVEVKATAEWIFTDVGLMGPLVRAEQVQHTNAAGSGDSGGPVISLTGPNWSLLMANGTISAGDLGTQVPCTGVTGNRLCAWRIWYADVNTALTRYGAGIATG